MINLDLIYKLYTLHLTLKLDKLENSLSNHLLLKKNLTDLLNSNKEHIDFYLNVKLSQILTYTSKQDLKNIAFPITKIYFEGKEINFKAIKLYIERYIYINNKYTKIRTEVRAIKKQIISYKVFKLIVEKANKKILNAILNYNYIFTPLDAFGSLAIIKNKCKRITVNWGESYKRRDKLLAEGKIPYIKKDAENNPDYKGEFWLVHNPEIDFFFHWFKCNPLIKYAPRLRYIKYEPARGKNSIVSKLAERKKNRKFCFRTYTNTLASYEGI